MMAVELTCSNFISSIKSMATRERNKIHQEDLINLIMQLPDDFKNNVMADIDLKFIELTAAINYIRTQTTSNTSEVLKLKNENITLSKENELVNLKLSNLKKELVNLKVKSNKQEEHINTLDQYLSVNNLEIVGIPPAEQAGDSVEDTLLEIFNDLPDLSNEVSENDIDVCHILPSDRKDGKLVAVCRFKSRKLRSKILEAKKKCRNFKFKNHDIYINDHLSPYNRCLFAIASTRKRELGYKFLLTRNGSLFMRENERLSVIQIISDECLAKLGSVNVDESAVSNGANVGMNGN